MSSIKQSMVSISVLIPPLAIILIIVPLTILIYGYCIYPLILLVVSSIKSPGLKKVKATTKAMPTITVIFTFAFEETDMLMERVKNIFETDYTSKLIQVVGVGDGPETQLQVQELNVNIGNHTNNQNIQFIATDKKRGKTTAQNKAVKIATGKILIFTDANSKFNKHTLTEIVTPLVNNIANENITEPKDEINSPSHRTGITVGNLTYTEKGTEKNYWKLENKLKTLESSVYSTIGANGALYGMRKKDYIHLPEHSISDIVQPLLQLLLNNKISSFIQSAKVYETTPQGYYSTYFRKRRITARALKSLPIVFPLLNPLSKIKYSNHYLLSFFFISHKVIRWATSMLLIVILSGISLGIYCFTPTPLTFFLYAITLLFIAIISMHIVIKNNIISPLLSTICHIYLTFLAQLWAYNAILCDINTNTWESADSMKFPKR